MTRASTTQPFRHPYIFRSAELLRQNHFTPLLIAGDCILIDLSDIVFRKHIRIVQRVDLSECLLAFRVQIVRGGILDFKDHPGTAAVVSPIGHLSYKGNVYEVSNNEIGALTQKLYDELTGIQWGKVEDKFGWIEFVCKG